MAGLMGKENLQTQDEKKLEESFCRSSLSLRGLLSSTKDVKCITPRGTIALVPVQEEKHSVQSEASVTRLFFDEESEKSFLSLCANGYDNLPEQLPPSSSEEEWRSVKYISKVKHTWYFSKCVKILGKDKIQFSAGATESLQAIARNLNLQPGKPRNDITAFFNEYGSYVPLGPFVKGGRCIQKVGSSDFSGTDYTKGLSELERIFAEKKPEEVDIRSEGGDSHIVHVGNQTTDRYIEFSHQVQLFGGKCQESDFLKWKKSITHSDLVVSGMASMEKAVPVWKILPYQDCLADEIRGILAELLEATWKQLNDAITIEGTCPLDTEGADSSVESDDYATAIDNDDIVLTGQLQTSAERQQTDCKREGQQKDLPELFASLNLDGKIHGLREFKVLRRETLENPDSATNVMWSFLNSISSLDYRGRKCIQIHVQCATRDNSADEVAKVNILDEDDFSDFDLIQSTNTLSSMDVIMAVLHSCDPFLRQEVMWKMAECRLAVPVLLSGVLENDPIEFQLWGLRKIYKSWIPRTQETPIEKSIVSHPLPIVAFMRLGNVALSKSKLLNKILGKLQGNNDHSFFVDVEDEPPCALWSKGNIEVAWFLPESVRSHKRESALLDAITFLNLRGDALKFPRQTEFVCRAADVVVLLVEESQYKGCLSQIKQASQFTSTNLICMICTKDKSKGQIIKRQGNITKMFTKPFLTDVGADICIEINRILWPPSEHNANGKSIESLTYLCNGLKFEIDEEKDVCIAAKTLALGIVRNVHESPETYKESKLPLQESLWGEWAALDKRWNDGFRPTQRFRTIEHYHDDLSKRMLEIRDQQISNEPDDDVVVFTEALRGEDVAKLFFIEWLNFYFNDLSQEKLGPLRKELRNIQNEARLINSQKSKLKDRPEKTDDDRAELERLAAHDMDLMKRAQEVTTKIDKGSVGIEHFIRELGQRYEAYEDTKCEHATDVDTKINPKVLPDIAADLLVNGYPLEILDGDVGRVPIKWVQSVLSSLIQRIGNTTVCAISVLGIQSSGKSTLLNSMFGVRFAVSAGRCTRGVFIQLLRVHEDLQKETQCEYIIVIDTEGLKAPERSLRHDFRHDNELATFALCLADLTIVNIAGQTVGKDMTDVLQIAGHAFIRMKEVHIKSSCRIIQQFVADLAAADKNEACTQAILNSLDESIAAAGKEEGYGDIYTRFSDVFNLKRNEDVQYIPSLWQGSMAPPNHRYSEKILKLKSIIVNDLKMSSRTMQQFVERTTTVWNAVKEENFIFSFQNCVIALRYKTFQHAYGKWVGEMRQAVMEWESNAKHTLKTAQGGKVDDMKKQLKREASTVVDKEGTKIEEQILGYLRENIEDDDDQLHKFEEEFLQDLDLTKRNFTQDAQESLERVADSIAQLNHMDILLPKCKNQLREKARSQAIELRKPHTDAPSLDNVISQQGINAKFNELWEGWIKEICDMYPPKSVTREDVESEFASYVYHQGEKKDISKGLKRKLGITRGKVARLAVNFVSTKIYGNQKDIIDKIIDQSLATLQIDINNELAFDSAIIQKLVDFSIDALNSKSTTLTQEVKVNTIAEICDRVIPMIFQGRCDYNRKYSLRELLTREKENLRKDFEALCSDASQDKRASENVNTLFEEGVAEFVMAFLGPAIYKAVRERCPYFVSKFALFGHVLEDMALREDFNSYYKFIFELEEFLEAWSLGRIAMICVETTSSENSFVQKVAIDKIEEISKCLIKSVESATTVSTQNDPEDDRAKFTDWITHLRINVQRNIPGLRFSDEDVTNLLMFNVKDVNFFGGQVIEYIAHSLANNVLQSLDLPSVGCREKAEVMLRSLPTKPHKEIKRHVSGCMEQCPICHVPCDNMTKQHEKHRAELHYPEGVVGCAAARDNRLACNICTSSVTTEEAYWDGQTRRRYCDYQKDFPSWVIQPVQNDTPLNYWKWVLNRFNKDFARLYGRMEADIPEGWRLITKRQALDDLREAYVTKKSSDSSVVSGSSCQKGQAVLCPNEHQSHPARNRDARRKYQKRR